MFSVTHKITGSSLCSVPLYLARQGSVVLVSSAAAYIPFPVSMTLCDSSQIRGNSPFIENGVCRNSRRFTEAFSELLIGKRGISSSVNACRRNTCRLFWTLTSKLGDQDTNQDRFPEQNAGNTSVSSLSSIPVAPSSPLSALRSWESTTSVKRPCWD